ncbi:hypothetical protein FGO68_gene1076 [Halteria grandinella]|uniref:Uncharacterized protein n=1 Tax=Halteria grandinella TaxID=5974 RepID=A0A8J8P4T4_HALGN|nr:hypothetical protein FGO68_gene1076 [Halteria grandinella]
MNRGRLNRFTCISGDKVCVEVVPVVGNLLFNLLPLIRVVLEHVPHIAEDNQDFILAPLVEVKYQVSGEVDWAVELVRIVYYVLAAVEHQPIPNAHSIHECFPDLLNGFIPGYPPQTDTEAQLVELNHVGFVSKKDLTLARGVKDQLVLLPILQ